MNGSRNAQVEQLGQLASLTQAFLNDLSKAHCPNTWWRPQEEWEIYDLESSPSLRNNPSLFPFIHLLLFVLKLEKRDWTRANQYELESLIGAVTAWAMRGLTVPAFFNPAKVSWANPALTEEEADLQLVDT